MGIPKPILVTGSHCSGTTWVGRMIASSPSVAYIHEPFNILHHDAGICEARFDNWFTYINEKNEQRYYRQIKNMIEFRYAWFDALQRSKRPSHITSHMMRYAQFARYRWSRTRPLLKDPFALFSAQWLSSRFNMETVVMIRHPAAFAGSLKERNWTYSFLHFVNQPLLMEEHLRPFEKEIMEFQKKEGDIIDQSALLWKSLYYMVLKYKRTNPDWTYIRHEDISRNPLDCFYSLFKALKLDFSEDTVQSIKRHSFPRSSAPMPRGNEHRELKRDSLENINSWKKRLTSSEIERLKSQVREISKEFYSEDEW